jgi:hypothetical protein
VTWQTCLQVELAAVLLACVIGIGVYISLRTCSIAYPLTLVWALVAVLLVGDRSKGVRVFAGIAAGICAVVAGVNLVTRVLGSAEYGRAVTADEKDTADSGAPDTSVQVA